MKKKLSLNNIFQLMLFKIENEFKTLKQTGSHNYKPFHLEGTYGIGKTTILTKLHKQLEENTNIEWGFVKWNLSTMSVHEIQGIPKIGLDSFKMIKNENLPTESTISHNIFPEQGILFIDEINHVDDEMKLSALYSLLQENILNGEKIPSGWFIVSASNTQEDLGIFHKLPPGVRDRLLIYDVENNFEEQFNYYKSINIHPVILSYLKINYRNGIDKSQTFNPTEEIEGTESSYIFTTRRSIEDVSNDIYLYEESGVNNIDLLHNLISGSVGEKEADQIINIYKSSNISATNKDSTPEIQPIDFTNNSINIDNEEELINIVNNIEYKDNNVNEYDRDKFQAVLNSKYFYKLHDKALIESNLKVFMILLITGNITKDIYASLDEIYLDKINSYCISNNIRVGDLLGTFN